MTTEQIAAADVGAIPDAVLEEAKVEAKPDLTDADVDYLRTKLKAITDPDVLAQKRQAETEFALCPGGRARALELFDARIAELPAELAALEAAAAAESGAETKEG